VVLEVVGGEEQNINEMGLIPYQKIMNKAIEELKENEFRTCIHPTEIYRN
jgi:hypothetical protein